MKTNTNQSKQQIPEDFLQYVWRYRAFETKNLKSVTGQSITVRHPGQQNFAGGPDFLNAMINIDGTLWAGHIEIHIRSSDWRRHGHTDDVHYKNVILHVVLEHDEEIYLRYPGDLQVLETKNLIPADQLERYKYWLQSKNWISCERQNPGQTQHIWTFWKDRLLVERLEQKTESIIELLEVCGGDWSETFYRKLARNFGFRANAEAMEMLAASLPYKIIQRHRSDPFQVMALLYGQAGMLNELFSDEYPNQLRQEYHFLQKKYGLHPLNSSVWNYGRLRPSNFPCIRIGQLAALLSQHEHLLSLFLNSKDTAEIRAVLNAPADVYWNNHYRFDTKVESGRIYRERRPGPESLDNILINTVSVFLFAYGKSKGIQELIDRALHILETCPPESNNIIKKWDSLGVPSKHSADTQALIQLYGVYCTTRRCLRCAVGIQLLKK